MIGFIRYRISFSWMNHSSSFLFSSVPQMIPTTNLIDVFSVISPNMNDWKHLFLLIAYERRPSRRRSAPASTVGSRGAYTSPQVTGRSWQSEQQSLNFQRRPRRRSLQVLGSPQGKLTFRCLLFIIFNSGFLGVFPDDAYVSYYIKT